MKLIIRYAKPFAGLIALCILLLFGQAVCELSLPNLMSDIVNVGIQKSGISEALPEAISENGMQLITMFLPTSAKQTFRQSYVQLPAGGYTVKGQQVQSDGTLYRLADNIQDTAALGDDYGKAVFAFFNCMQANAGESGAVLPSDGIAELSAEQLYAILPMVRQIPQETVNRAIDAAQQGDAMLYGQMGSAFTRLFYTEIGLDFVKMQKSYIWATGAKMLAVALISVLAAICVGFLSARIGSAVARNMRRDVFSKVESFSNREFDRFSTASLITRTTNDVQQMQILLVMGLRMMTFAPIMGIGGVIMALRKSVSLSWIIAVAVLVIMGIICILFVVAIPRFKSLQRLIDRLNLVSRETLSGMMVIRAFGNQAYEEARFDRANADLRDTNRFVHRTLALLLPAMMLILNLVSLTIIWVGGHAIAASTLQIGDMMAFIQYAMQIITSFLLIAVIFVMVPRAAVSAARIREVLETELAITDPEQPKSIPAGDCTVEFDHVFFRYQNAEHDVLHDISFTAKPGQTTAFIGATGSGKSSLVNLIPRFYDVTEGAVRINGVDVREVTQQDLRAKIGYVPQKGVLFSGTIRSNVQYGAEEASDAEVEHAIEVAQATEFVSTMPNTVNAPIAQGGGNVSGGQKQRLSIARALATKAPIYIFDDSFSALDFQTDAALRQALKADTAQATVLIVAQRVSTILHADQIIVLDRGQVMGIGTHKELLQNCTTYREIAESQLAKEELQ